MRQFWLSNADDVVYSLNEVKPNGVDVFLHDPSGLGYTVEMSTIKLGNSNLIINEDYVLPPLEGEVLFKGTLRNVYQQYQEFIRFLSKRPITLHYLPPNTFNSYGCSIRVTSLEKTEVQTDGLLHCPIIMNRQTLWSSDNPNIIDSSNSISNGKSYPLSRPYTYGEVSLENIRMTNDGMTDAPIKVEIFGACTDPSYNLYDDENNLYGSCKILGTYDYVMVDSGDLTEEIILKRNGSVIANAVNQQDLTVGSPNQVYVTFLRLHPGVSKLAFDMDENFTGTVRITWSNFYVSV